MPEWRTILELWRQAQAAGEEACLVTVVRTEGSSYRKPGARMLLTRSGRRAGTVSGGCLEAEIQKKAWWLCERGPAVECYSSAFEGDSEIPYGLACGGTIWVLLERGENAVRALKAIADCVQQRLDVTFVYSIDSQNSSNVGTRVILRQDGKLLAGNEIDDGQWMELAQKTLAKGVSSCVETPQGLVFAEYMAPPQRLFVFGAGDDAQPVVHFAHALGWQTVVADGRSNLATQARFPLAGSICRLQPGDDVLYSLEIGPRDAVVVMTHSYDQDRNVLRHVLPMEPAYLGVLGPRHRTNWLMRDPAVASACAGGWDRIHTPVGLDIGAEGPAAIALSIVAEIQSVLASPAKSLYSVASTSDATLVT